VQQHGFFYFAAALSLLKGRLQKKEGKCKAFPSLILCWSPPPGITERERGNPKVGQGRAQKTL